MVILSGRLGPVYPLLENFHSSRLTGNGTSPQPFSATMWGNIAKAAQGVVQKVKAFQNEIEASLDEAVGAEDSFNLSPAAADATSSAPPPQSPNASMAATSSDAQAALGGNVAKTLLADRYDDVSLESPLPAEKQPASGASEVGKSEPAASAPTAPAPAVPPAATPTPTHAATPTAAVAATTTDAAAKTKKVADDMGAELIKTRATLQAAEAEAKRLSEASAKSQKTASAELVAKDKEIAKLGESKAQLTQVVEETQSMLKKTEADLRAANKNLAALQAVNQSFTNKLTALEGQMAVKVDEMAAQSSQIATQKRSLEASMSVTTDLRRDIAELKASAASLSPRAAESAENSARLQELIDEVQAARQKIVSLEAELEAEKKTLAAHTARKSLTPVDEKTSAGGGSKSEQSAKAEVSALRKKVAELEKTTKDAVSLRDRVRDLQAELDAARKTQAKDKQDAAAVEARAQGLQKTLDEANAAASTKSDSSSSQVVALQTQVAALQQSLDEANAAASTKSDSSSSQVVALQTQVAALQQSLDEAKQDDASKQASAAEHAAAHAAELAKMQEVIKDRERALESAALKMAETHRQLEEASKKLADLHTEMAEKDANIRELATSTIGESDARRQVAQYLEQLKVQNERLASFELEGQTLSKKQGEMEKLVRKTNLEMKAKDKEIAKLGESKAQLSKVIEEMQEALRKNESDVSSSHKSLSAMQAVSQASTDKLAKLEAEVVTKADEILSQKRALESAWAEANELKRGIAEMRAERDDLKRQIGEGTSRVIETESSVRDIATREAVLRATNKQLQDGMQRQMQESSSREERLRDEVNEMRKRWQEAITSREALATEMGCATAPLLRQISALQDSLRVRGESWQSIESTLSERALRAESAAEVIEHKRSMMEEQLTACKQQLSITATRLQDAQQLLHLAEAQVDRMRRAEASSIETAAELEARLSLESGQRQSLQASLRELEVRHKLDTAELRDSLDAALKQAEAHARFKADCESLQQQLEAERSKGSPGGFSATGGVGAVSRSKQQIEQDAGDLSPSKPAINMAEVLPSEFPVPASSFSINISLPPTQTLT